MEAVSHAPVASKSRKHGRVSLAINEGNAVKNASMMERKQQLSDSDEVSMKSSFKRRRVSLDPILDYAPSNQVKSTIMNIRRKNSGTPTSNHSNLFTVHSFSQNVTSQTITPSPSVLSIYHAESMDLFERSPSSSISPEHETSDDCLGLELEADEVFPPPTSVAPATYQVDSTILQEIDNHTESNPCAQYENQPMSCSPSLFSTLCTPIWWWKNARKQKYTDSSFIVTDRKVTSGGKRLAHDVLLLSCILLLVFGIGQGISIWTQVNTRLHLADKECIYVTGGGFSGFWFSLGRLHSLSRNEMRKERFTCYSAGCLGVVSVYTNRTMEELYGMASGIQRDWIDGSLHRYHIVENFVDNLLQDQDFDQQTLSSLHILTSVPQEPIGFRAVLNTPNNMEELRTLLMQTTWIPLAVGSEFTHHGHLDGAFSAFQHPKCNRHVGLASDWTLLTNTLNVNLGRDRVEQFWQLGLDYGV